MGLTNKMNRLIKEEIANDPEKMGYAGKTDKEIAELLSNSVFKSRIVVDAICPPLSRILRNLEGSSNIITEEEVKQAKIITVEV